MSETRLQLARADGKPDWRVNAVTFDRLWDVAYDRLRFFRGEGFTLQRRPDDPSRPLKLGEIRSRLEARLAKAKDDVVFEVRSMQNRKYALIFRRHVVFVERGEIFVSHGLQKIGTPYSLGNWDCSGLTAYEADCEGIYLPHKAGDPQIPSQLHDNKVLHISKDRKNLLKTGDLLFHWGNLSACDHVSTFLDWQGPGGTGRVLDTEPHDTGAPRGWPSSHLGTGVRIRPMITGYYCDWEHVIVIGRIAEINGEP